MQFIYKIIQSNLLAMKLLIFGILNYEINLLNYAIM